MTHDNAYEALQVAVVGAGQSGLALGYHLQQRGIEFRLFEAAGEVGDAWAHRWDLLRLFTPARYSALPGLRFPGHAWSYPSKDDVATYLRGYARHFHLPVQTRARVTELREELGSFRLRLSTGEQVEAKQVVIATGAFGRPIVPGLAAELGPEVSQLHSSSYKNPDHVPGSSIVVVGGGNSGFQIAHELALAGKTVALSEGTRLRALPQRVLGRDLFWWLSATGIVRAPVSSFIGQRLRASEPVIGTTRRMLRSAGVELLTRATGASGRCLTFQDGTQREVDAVVWATGFRHDDAWISGQDARGGQGTLNNVDGVTRVAGLYTLGRPWQRDRGSALLGFVGRDAQRLAQRIDARIAADRSGC